MSSLSIHPQSLFRYFFALLLVATLCACGSSDSTQAPEPDSNTSEGNGDGSGEGNADGGGSDGGVNEMEGTDSGPNDPPATGAFDLADYTFHANVRTEGGEISWSEIIYGQEDTGDGAFLRLERRFVNNGGIIEEYSAGELIKTFTIADSGITETFIDPPDSRVSQRSADIGDEYLNANSAPDPDAPIAVVQNATCVLQEALETFDLSTATGNQMLASGVYEDVIKVLCLTGFVQGDTVNNHSTVTSYFAKDVGLIFSEGNVLFLDEVYIVEEY